MPIKFESGTTVAPGTGKSVAAHNGARRYFSSI